MHPPVKGSVQTPPETISDFAHGSEPEEVRLQPQPTFILWYGRRSPHAKAFRKAWRSLGPGESLLHFAAAPRVIPFLMDPTTILPRVVVLEANTHGFKLLPMIRSAPALSKLPVAMVAQAGRFSDVASAYALGADWCFVAPQDAEQARFFAEALFAHFRKGPARRAAPIPIKSELQKLPPGNDDHWLNMFAHEFHSRWDDLLAWGKSRMHL